MVRFGILGAGNIAHRFAESLSHAAGATLVAASRRSAGAAEEFLGEVPHAPDARAYGDHAQLLADPRVDAIYLSLPHHLHRTWALEALRAGKAVLCEKPATLSATEMAEVAGVARETKTLFMEAMKPRFQPLYPLVFCYAHELGPVTRVEASLCNDMLGFVGDGKTYHMAAGPGAGVLLDCGTYCASWIDELCPGTPQVTHVTGVQRDGIDVYADAWLDLGGVRVRLECAFDRAKPRTCTIVCEDGKVVVDELHRPTSAVMYYDDGYQRTLDMPYEVDDFYGEITHFVGLVEAGEAESPIMPLEDSVRIALILDKVRERLAPTPEALGARS